MVEEVCFDFEFYFYILACFFFFKEVIILVQEVVDLFGNFVVVEVFLFYFEIGGLYIIYVFFYKDFGLVFLVFVVVEE